MKTDLRSAFRMIQTGFSQLLNVAEKHNLDLAEGYPFCDDLEEICSQIASRRDAQLAAATRVEPLSQRETARIFRYAQILHREAVYHPGGGPRRVIWTAKDGSDYTLATLEDVALVLGQDGLAYVIATDD